jgi:hypothetical protein
VNYLKGGGDGACRDWCFRQEDLHIQRPTWGKLTKGTEEGPCGYCMVPDIKELATTERGPDQK